MLAASTMKSRRVQPQSYNRVCHLTCFLFTCARAAAAETTAPLPDPPPASEQARGEDFRASFWLTDSRVEAMRGDPHVARFQLHGEYQLREEGLTQLRLSDYGLNGYERQLGQTQRLSHYFRWTPVFTYRTNLRVIGQLDLPSGLALGDATSGVDADYYPQSHRQPMALAPRWLYVEVAASRGILRIGQQPATWGSGVLLNSGDERLAFGDPRGGTIVERVSWKGRPFGARTPFELLVASDLVFADRQSRLIDGDVTVQSMVGASYVAGAQRRLGLLVLGQERQPNVARIGPLLGKPMERTVTLDVAGSWNALVPGQSTHIFAEVEVAQVLGVTQSGDFGHGANGPQASVRRFGAFARVGALSTKGVADQRWGHFGVSLEWAWASADSNTNNRADTRFVFEPNRRVGLVLFDEVLRWKTARAAVAGQALAAGFSVPRDIASQGGFFGATYLAPSILYRPHPRVDVRGSLLVAEATRDFVDPVRMRSTGECRNYDGGSCRARDLGMELDAGIEYRQPLRGGTAASLGAQGGLLLPGHAFDDAQGNRLRTQSVVMARFGFYM
jgi:hypothetical protein